MRYIETLTRVIPKTTGSHLGVVALCVTFALCPAKGVAQHLTTSSSPPCADSSDSLCIPPTFRYVELGAFLPVDISDNGYVVGNSHSGNGVLWHQGQSTDLGPARTYDVDDQGRVLISTTPLSAYRWENGMVTPLSVPFGNWRGNNAGMVVGTEYLGGGRNRAFVWSSGQLVHPIAADNLNSSAYAVNQQGEVAVVVDIRGQFDDLPRTRIWTPTGVIAEFPGDTIALNEVGQALIYDYTPNLDSYLHDYATNSRTWINLTSIPLDHPPPEGAFEFWETVGTINDLNDASQVVGRLSDAYGSESNDPCCHTTRAFFWTPATGAHNLRDLVIDSPVDWTSAEAIAINNRGQIVGYSNGIAFLLTPVPEPNSWAIVALGTVFAVLVRRPRKPESPCGSSSTTS